MSTALNNTDSSGVDSTSPTTYKTNPAPSGVVRTVTMGGSVDSTNFNETNKPIELEIPSFNPTDLKSPSMTPPSFGPPKLGGRSGR